MSARGWAMRRNVLLLQGPVGPFFSRFARDLECRGFNVFKVNFNGGDTFFYRRNRSIDYTGKLKYWGAYLERLVRNKDIGRIYLFGDCRAYHRVAIDIGKRSNIRIFVFEEGYIRPDYITLEEDGVNGHSRMLRGALDLSRAKGRESPPTWQCRNVFVRTAFYSMAYYFSAAWHRRKFRFYQHHRSLHLLTEGIPWIVSAWRKWRYARRDRSFLSELLPQFEANYFVVPLQVHCDMQVAIHSDFNSIEHFIGDVISSFAEHAPSNKALVFKHHPMDRGYTDYSLLFDNLISEHGLQGRVFYVHDVCLPILLKSAQGTVLINSTVGMSSLFHGTPVKTLGKAIYDQPGLTYARGLDSFWRGSGNVDADTYERFRHYLITHNQINGSLYKPLPQTADYAGLVWSTRLIENHVYVAHKIEITGPQLKLIGGRDIPAGGLMGTAQHDDQDVA